MAIVIFQNIHAIDVTMAGILSSVFSKGMYTLKDPENVSKFKTLVNHSGLFVMQTEFSVYVLLRLWIYLIFHPNWDGSPQDAVMSSHKFFQVKKVAILL